MSKQTVTSEAMSIQCRDPNVLNRPSYAMFEDVDAICIGSLRQTSSLIAGYTMDSMLDFIKYLVSQSNAHPIHGKFELVKAVGTLTWSKISDVD